MRRPFALIAATVLLLAACSGAATPAPPAPTPDAMKSPDAMGTKAPDAMKSPDAMGTKAPDAMGTPDAMKSPDAMGTPDAMKSPDAMASAAPYNGPAFASLPLVDAETGETFTFSQFAGKIVFVEPFATWCTNCRRQLPNVDKARQALDDGYVFVALSVAENIDRNGLRAYAKENGWKFIYAAATDPLTQGLVDAFGRKVVTPPSTPHFIIGPDGTLGELVTGSHDADSLVAELRNAPGQ